MSTPSILPACSSFPLRCMSCAKNLGQFYDIVTFWTQEFAIRQYRRQGIPHCTELETTLATILPPDHAMKTIATPSLVFTNTNVHDHNTATAFFDTLTSSSRTTTGGYDGRVHQDARDTDANTLYGYMEDFCEPPVTIATMLDLCVLLDVNPACCGRVLMNWTSRVEVVHAYELWNRWIPHSLDWRERVKFTCLSDPGPRAIPTTLHATYAAN